jgi:biopolymer transport protein ExbD
MIPMIDVMLVLLIIFMLKGARQVIPVSDSLLEAVLGQIDEGRPTKLLYVKASDDRSYQEVIQVFDRVRAAGVQVISLMPDSASTPQAAA